MPPERYEPAEGERPVPKGQEADDQMDGVETNDEMDLSESKDEKPSIENVEFALTELRNIVDKFKSKPKRAEKMASDPEFREKVYSVLSSSVIDSMAKLGVPLSDAEITVVNAIVKDVIDGKFDLHTGEVVQPGAQSSSQSSKRVVRRESFMGDSGSPEHKAYLAKGYIEGGKLNVAGQRFLAKMNPGSVRGLRRSVAVMERRSIGVTTDMSVPVSEEDVIKALQV